jgi:hypothetical protein
MRRSLRWGVQVVNAKRERVVVSTHLTRFAAELRAWEIADGDDKADPVVIRVAYYGPKEDA